MIPVLVIAVAWAAGGEPADGEVLVLPEQRVDQVLPAARVALASWYGSPADGTLGNRTACGQLYTTEILGLAHRTLPCGTLVWLSHRDRSVVVAVIDRGPYVDGREFDLSAATRAALGCPDLCWVEWR